MNRIWAFIILLLLAGGLTAGCQGLKDGLPKNEKQGKNAEILVLAASSMADALNEINKVYAERHGDVKVIFSFASSGTLQKQIERSVPADLYISAGQQQMDDLERKGLISEETRQDLLSNELVLVAGKDCGDINGFRDLTSSSVAKIAMGAWETVPAGNYAKEALENLKLWEDIQDKLVFAKDVRQVLAYVETGNAEAGLVYLTDIKTAANVKIAAAAPPGSHKPIVYPAAVIKNSANRDAAKKFLNYLQSDEAQAIFRKYGFNKVDAEEK